jgi:hypothetical protein
MKALKYIIPLLLIGVCFAAFDATKPAANRPLNLAYSDIRANFAAIDANMGDSVSSTWQTLLALSPSSWFQDFVADANTTEARATIETYTVLDEDNFISNDPNNPPSQQSTLVAMTAGTMTMTNKTLTSPVLNGSLSGAAFIDDDTMATADSNIVASAESIKAYIDEHSIIQTVNDVNVAVDTIANQIPADDTQPGITEGGEILSVAMTPTSASSRIKVTVQATVAVNAENETVVMVLYRGNDPLAVTSQFSGPTAHTTDNLGIEYIGPSPGTSPGTYSVRVGPVGATTVTVNGSNGSRLYGGIMACTLIVQEIE